MSSKRQGDSALPGDPVDAVIDSFRRIRGLRGPHGGPPGPHGFGPFAEKGAGQHRRGPWPPGANDRFGGPARFRLLEALAASPEPLSVSELADAIGVDQPRASRLVQQAVALDLVAREADPEDARRTRIALTEHGRSLAGGMRGHRRETVRAALDALTDDERAEFVRLLAKFAGGWPQR